MFGVNDQETVLEIGLLALGLGILGGIGAVLYGRVRRSAWLGDGRAQNPPPPGSVSGERHQNIQTVAAR